MRYYAEWIQGKEWCVIDLKTDKVIVTGLHQNTAKFVCLVLNLRKERHDA
jgi:hypothetical protein